MIRVYRLLFDRCVGARPLSNRSTIAPPPRTSLFLRPPGGRVLPCFLSSVWSEVKQLQSGQHRLDPAPLRFVGLIHLAAGPQVAAKVTASSGSQRISRVGGRVPRR